MHFPTSFAEERNWECVNVCRCRAMGAFAMGGLGEMFQADGLASRALLRAVRSFSAGHGLSNCTVLDIGCGTMPYRSLFTSRGARYLGADIDGTPDIFIGPDG